MEYTLTNEAGESYAAGGNFPVYSDALGGWITSNGNLLDPDRIYSVTATESAPTYALLTPMQFYLAFTASERMVIKLLAENGLPANSMFNSTANPIPQDAVIAEFWATYQMAVSSNAHVDPNLPSIQGALAYLAKPTSPTPAVIAADRISSILQGVAQ